MKETLLDKVICGVGIVCIGALFAYVAVGCL